MAPISLDQFPSPYAYTRPVWHSRDTVETPSCWRSFARGLSRVAKRLLPRSQGRYHDELDDNSTEEQQRRPGWRHGGRYGEFSEKEQPYTPRSRAQHGTPFHFATQQYQRPPTQYQPRSSGGTMPDFDMMQHSLGLEQQHLHTVSYPQVPDFSHPNFDRLRKEILSNAWALLYLQHGRQADIDPVLVVESSMASVPHHVPPPTSRHSASTSHPDWPRSSKEQFTAVIANHGQPFIQGAMGESHGEALELLLQATAEAVHMNRHRFFFNGDNKRRSGMQRSGGWIDAGTVAGAAFGRERAMGMAM